MNSAILICLFAVVGFAVSKPDGYTTKFDSVDVDGILKNDRLLNAYCNCLLNIGTCTPDAAELKKLLPDALENNCASCNEHQKKNAKKVLLFLIKHKPEIFAKLEKLYDPSGKYKTKYCQDAKKEGISVNECN